VVEVVGVVVALAVVAMLGWALAAREACRAILAAAVVVVVVVVVV
jgi:hypothetical protein